MTTRNNKGRNSGKSATPKTTAVDSKHRAPKAQDMSGAAQRKRILEYLRAGHQTTYSLRKHGISHPAARVRELIAGGYQIEMHPVTAIDSDGFMHRRVALYELIGELDLTVTREASAMIQIILSQADDPERVEIRSSSIGGDTAAKA